MPRRPRAMLALMKYGLLLAALASAAACSASPPAHWAQGGAQLEIPKARWVIGTATVDVYPDGKVLVNGEQNLTVDRAGRVYDEENQPVALLEPDGRLIGPDDEALGVVGAMHASRPGEQNAWISVAPSGEVVSYDDEGERHLAGVWIGCNATPRTHQVCTLITHLLAMRIKAATERESGGPSVGIGIGVGVPIR